MQLQHSIVASVSIHPRHGQTAQYLVNYSGIGTLMEAQVDFTVEVYKDMYKI